MRNGEWYSQRIGCHRWSCRVVWCDSDWHSRRYRNRQRKIIQRLNITISLWYCKWNVRICSQRWWSPQWCRNNYCRIGIYDLQTLERNRVITGIGWKICYRMDISINKKRLRWNSQRSYFWWKSSIKYAIDWYWNWCHKWYVDCGSCINSVSSRRYSRKNVCNCSKSSVESWWCKLYLAENIAGVVICSKCEIVHLWQRRIGNAPNWYLKSTTWRYNRSSCNINNQIVDRINWT